MVILYVHEVSVKMVSMGKARTVFEAGSALPPRVLGIELRESGLCDMYFNLRSHLNDLDVFSFFVLLGNEPNTSLMLGKCTPTEPSLQPKDESDPQC